MTPFEDLKFPIEYWCLTVEYNISSIGRFGLFSNDTMESFRLRSKELWNSEIIVFAQAQFDGSFAAWKDDSLTEVIQFDREIGPNVREYLEHYSSFEEWALAELKSAMHCDS